MERIFALYKELDLGKNASCLQCREKCQGKDAISMPISPWQIGPKYHEDPYRLLFVGKTARGEVGIETPGGYLDARPEGQRCFDEYKRWPYWGYTSELLARLFGNPNEGWERIAFTNLIKCNASSKQDCTTQQMKENCLKNLGVAWREIQILAPRQIIFYTGWTYDDYIVEWSKTIGNRIVDRSGRDHIEPNGKRSIPWWHREIYADDKLVLRFLRTGHPERKNKEDYLNSLLNWIKQPAGI